MSCQDLAIDADGQVLVADNGAGAVLVFESSGKLIRTIGAGKGTKQGQFKDISAVAVDPATGDVIVADSRIQARLNSAGFLVMVVGFGFWVFFATGERVYLVRGHP